LVEGRHDLQVNLYLYQADVDGYLRNTDPAGIRPGETGTPALPLILHYLITPYVRNGTDFDAHRMLGAAMRTLYEHPVLTRQDPEINFAWGAGSLAQDLLGQPRLLPRMLFGADPRPLLGLI
jgi:hypothetical protein